MSDEPKILILYPFDINGATYGGIDSVIADFIKYAPEDVSFSIVGISSKMSEIEMGRWHSIELYGRIINFLPIVHIDMNRKRYIPFILKYAIELRRNKSKIKFNNSIIMYHRIEPAYFLGRVDSKKEILFMHGDMRNFKNHYSDSKWKRIHNLYFLLEPYFIKRMDSIYIVSRSGVEYYRNRYPEIKDRFKFMPIWPDSKVFKRINIDKLGILSKFGIIERSPLILFVGRLELVKDPKLLILSYSYIYKEYPNSALIIVGTGSMLSYVKNYIAKLGIAKNVFLIGQRSQKEVAELMNCCNVLLLTSAFEGMPKVVLEALSCGLPVVTTNVGEVGLIVKEGISGKIVYSRDPFQVAKAVSDIIKKPPIPNLCEELVKNYAPEKIVNHIFCEVRTLK